MDLGTFSISLAVKDLATSRGFYEKLGFDVVPASGAGAVWDSYNDTWVMLSHRSGTPEEIKIGLFQGMFDANTLTFNPGDVRALQKRLEDQGIELIMKADGDSGPGAAMLLDPDGNPILLDQH